MTKLLQCLIFSSFAMCLSFNAALADSIITPEGEVLKGKIEYVVSGLIEIKTDTGNKKIVRELKSGSARDIIEVKSKGKINRLTGRVLYLDEFKVVMIQAKQSLHIKRSKVKKIILSQMDLPKI